MNLGENIYKYRTSKNWSQAEFADELEVSRQSVSKWENNMATPDLDKLIKMKILFGISLDELVFGQSDTAKEPEQKNAPAPDKLSYVRLVFGTGLLMFGMVFFLLSVFWGDHLYFGEAFGELLSAVLVLISVAIIAPYNFRALTVCSIIFFIYSIICFGILNIVNISNSIFTFIASIIIVVWFIVCGTHATKSDEKKE